MTLFRHWLRRFVRDEHGNLIVEGVLVLPILIWAFAALFAYWDAYRSINNVQKATYTISDLISRKQDSVNDAYVAGVRTTMNYLLDANQAGSIRVTSFRWSQADLRYEVIWSRVVGGTKLVLTDATLADLSTRLPKMFDGDSAVLVEAAVPYTPPVAYGLEPTTIEQFVVTRPRFLPRICHVDESCAIDPPAVPEPEDGV